MDSNDLLEELEIIIKNHEDDFDKGKGKEIILSWIRNRKPVHTYLVAIQYRYNYNHDITLYRLVKAKTKQEAENKTREKFDNRDIINVLETIE